MHVHVKVTWNLLVARSYASTSGDLSTHLQPLNLLQVPTSGPNTGPVTPSTYPPYRPWGNRKKGSNHPFLPLLWQSSGLAGLSKCRCESQALRPVTAIILSYCFVSSYPAPFLRPPTPPSDSTEGFPLRPPPDNPNRFRVRTCGARTNHGNILFALLIVSSALGSCGASTSPNRCPTSSTVASPTDAASHAQHNPPHRPKLTSTMEGEGEAPACQRGNGKLKKSLVSELPPPRKGAPSFGRRIDLHRQTCRAAGGWKHQTNESHCPPRSWLAHWADSGTPMSAIFAPSQTTARVHALHLFGPACPPAASRKCRLPCSRNFPFAVRGRELFNFPDPPQVNPGKRNQQAHIPSILIMPYQ
ncbi:hypothetical protein CDEST_13699 [Colletotrichum destructivum]|uniref:Uncharacterized protein n=1 Tax=Colletotrichum destructivum TaxID=34406 RepID=A0AAX4IZT5_9PEZI|nr:hypothetical protein CDEST_13699 [Colletotrichum destructivum]